jgi:predicted phosphodiesterase
VVDGDERRSVPIATPHTHAMKCLLVSDLHYVLKQFDWVGNVAKDFDVVIIAGDHLDISSTVEARVQIAVILTYVKRLRDKTRLIVSSGNHDLDARNADGEKVAKWLSKVRGLLDGLKAHCARQSSKPRAKKRAWDKHRQRCHFLPS